MCSDAVIMGKRTPTAELGGDRGPETPPAHEAILINYCVTRIRFTVQTTHRLHRALTLAPGDHQIWQRWLAEIMFRRHSLQIAATDSAASGCYCTGWGCHYPIGPPARSVLRMCEMVRHIGQLHAATLLGHLTQWLLAKQKKNRERLLLLQGDFTII